MRVTPAHQVWATTLGGALVLAGSALPWLRSGARGRSSYELYGLARRLDLLGGQTASWVLAVWPLVPTVVVAAAVAGWWGRPALSRLGAAVGAAYVAVVCVLAWRAPLASAPGIAVSFSGALILLAAALAGRRAGPTAAA